MGKIDRYKNITKFEPCAYFLGCIVCLYLLLLFDDLPVVNIKHITCWNSMMTSSNGNVFRVTGLLCGEFTGPRWIPRTKASDAGLWCFPWSVPEQTVDQTMVRLVIWDAIAPIITSFWWQKESRLCLWRKIVAGYLSKKSIWDVNIRQIKMKHRFITRDIFEYV